MTREKELTYVDVEDFQKYFKWWLEDFCYEIAREVESECDLYLNVIIGGEKIDIDMKVYCDWYIEETPSDGINPPESEIIMSGWEWDELSVWDDDSPSFKWKAIVEKSFNKVFYTR